MGGNRPAAENRLGKNFVADPDSGPDSVPAARIRFYLHKEFRAAGIRFYLHKEFRAAEIRFSLHKEFRAAEIRFYQHKRVRSLFEIFE